MSVYALLRAIAGVALRWYYRDIQVERLERIPRQRPLLLVVNHPNALVDALLVVWIVPRRVLITAKAHAVRESDGWRAPPMDWRRSAAPHERRDSRQIASIHRAIARRSARSTTRCSVAAPS